MTTPEKESHCLPKEENMENDGLPVSDASTDTDEEVVEENFSCYTGVKLIYFEHSYTKNYAVLCEMYESSNLDSKEHVTVECTESQQPVRRSQRHISKDIVTVSGADLSTSVQSPMKDEEREIESSDIDSNNISDIKTSPLKSKSPKNENKIGDHIVSSTNIHPKKKLLHELSSPSKALKKAKVVLERESETDLKRKLSGKEEFPALDVEAKDAAIHPETRRKRAYSEPSKSDSYSAGEDNADKEITKNKRMKGLTKHKTKKGEKLNQSPNKLKERKRNKSTPCEKMAIVKNNEKISENSSKGKRKMSQDSVPKEFAKNENKKSLVVDSKGLPTKGPTYLPSSSVVKSKFKKSSRRESLRLIVNEDEPPLFSQPDMMVKVKLDDPLKKEEKTPDDTLKKDEKVTDDSLKKEEKALVDPLKKDGKRTDEPLKKEEKSSIDLLKKEVKTADEPLKREGKKSDEPLKREGKASDEPLKKEENTLDDPLKIEERTSEQIVDVPVSVSSVTHSEISEIFNIIPENPDRIEAILGNFESTNKEDHDDKEDFKDIDSENSLHIDESVGKIFEGEDENFKNDQNENTSDSSVLLNKFKRSNADGVESIPGEVLNIDFQHTIKAEMKDSDSDKPIAERKPRRIIKKKEFFEDIASRSSTQTRKSAGKQKANGDKKSNDDDSKQKVKITYKSDVESEESSEDDPLKLWCICRQPHNDRFMIQCDKCEDWFHGSCVGISRQQGRKLEKQQKEWICPNCISKGSEKIKTETFSEKKVELEMKKVKVEKERMDARMQQINPLSRKEKNTDRSQMKNQERQNTPSSSTTSSSTKNDVPSNICNKKNFNKIIRSNSKGNEHSSNVKRGLREPIRKRQNCVSCQAIAPLNSCYCSDKCLEKHAADCLTIMQEGRSNSKGSDLDSPKIVVLDRIKGNVIAGENAPTAANIVSWLKANPSFMIACSGSSASFKHAVQKKEIDSSSPAKDKKETTDDSSKATVRCNVRKTLKNILMDRCKNADDIHLPEEDVRKIAVKIEEELNSLFKDNSFKYRAKYRSLMFNIKDPRNQGLFRKILKGNIPPDKLVRMSPEELASVELARWREQENQHLLDMIKRVQLEQQSGSGLLLKKTHKGEVEIEDDFGVIDDIPKTTPTKLFSPEPPPEAEKPEPDKEIVVKDTTHHHRSHLFDLNCKICTGKMIPPPTEDSTPKKVRVAHSISVDLSSPATLDPVEKSVSRIVDGKSPLSSTGDDSVDQEPTSTVSIGSPEISMKFVSDNENGGKVASSVWKGFIYMQDVAKFVTSAYKVSGQTEYLHVDVPDTIQVCGRIIPDQVWDYLGKIKQSGNKELIIVRFQAANEEETVTYNSFYSYLSSRKRYGVVSNYSKKIKDFYILPLAATSPVPIVLMPFDGPGLPSPRPHLLLGVIVRHKVKQGSAGVMKKEKSNEDADKLDGSYTPPLETRSYTPPLPSSQSDNSINMTPDTVFSSPVDLKSSLSSEESDATQNSSTLSADVKNEDESEIYEPSYTPPLQILPPDSPKEEDKPYDPEQDILNIETDKKASGSSPKQNVEKAAGSENLEKHKKILDALTRQVEETDRQVNALKQLISNPDDSDTDFQSPNAPNLDINSVTATGMSSFLDLPENLQDILNVVREKSLGKEKLAASKGDVDMRINRLFSKSFNKSAYQASNESDKANNTLDKNHSQGATPPLEDSEESSPAVVRPSDPRIKIRTSFQESSFSSEEPANVSLSNMSVTELVERAEKELAEMEALEKAQNTQTVSLNQEKLDISSSWNQYKEPPPPGIEPSDLTAEDSTYSSKTISSTSTSDNSLPSSFSSPLIQDTQQVGPHFPPPFPPPLPPGFPIQTPPPNIKNFPPPNVITTSFPPPPLPIVTKASDVSPISETWPAWNIPPQQSKDSNWQNRVPQWDENWKSTTETASIDESGSHFYPPGTHDFNKDQFYRGESSSEGRWNRPRFGRNNWNKRPPRGGRWRGKRSFHFNKNQRN